MVDDEVLIADLWCMILTDMGVNVCGIAPSAAIAIALAERHRPKVILMDFRLKGVKDGVDAALTIGASLKSRIIFITGSSEPSTISRIGLCQPAAILFKPVSERQLQSAVHEALRA